MEWIVCVEWLLGVLVGISVTITFTKFVTRSWTIGALNINLVDPEEETLKLTIDANLDDMPRKKFVILLVKTQK